MDIEVLKEGLPKKISLRIDWDSSYEVNYKIPGSSATLEPKISGIGWTVHTNYNTLVGSLHYYFEEETWIFHQINPGKAKIITEFENQTQIVEFLKDLEKALN